VVRALFFLETPHRLAGAQRSLLAALSRIHTYGIDPLVVFPGSGSVEEAYRGAGINTRIVPAPPSLMLFNKRFLGLTAFQKGEVLFREMLPYNATLARLIRAERFDVVHFNQPRGILVAGLAPKLARRPSVLHLRGQPDGLSRSVWTAAQLLADRIVLVAKNIESGVGRAFRNRCVVVYNGVAEQPPRNREAARRALAARIGQPTMATSDEVLFVSLSSLTPFKGLHHLLTAAAILRDRGVRARFVFAGGGEDDRYREFIVRRRDALGLDEIVDLLGFVDDPLTVLAAADALVLPSVFREQLEIDGETIDVRCSEGLPRSILEAMSLGVPVVGTDIVGVREQVDDGITGHVVPAADPEALAVALERAARDSSWRVAAGIEARRVARSRFTVDGAAAGLADVLHSLHRYTPSHRGASHGQEHRDRANR